MNPRQDNVARHLADDAWIVPIAGQSRIGRVAIGNQRGSALHVGLYESFDRPGGIVGDHGKADAARTCIEVFGVLASRPSLIDAAIDHLDGPDDEDFAGIAGFEERIAFTEGNFRLIDFDDPLQWFAIRIDHRSSQLLRQQPGGLVGDAELVLQLSRRHTVGMRRHEMRGPKPCRQRQLGAMHRRARRDRGLSTTIKAFVQTRSAFQHRRAAFAAARADETVRPASFEQERNAARFVRKCLLEFGKRARPSHRGYVLATSRGRLHNTLHLERPESTG